MSQQFRGAACIEPDVKPLAPAEALLVIVIVVAATVLAVAGMPSPGESALLGGSCALGARLVRRLRVVDLRHVSTELGQA